MVLMMWIWAKWHQPTLDWCLNYARLVGSRFIFFWLDVWQLNSTSLSLTLSPFLSHSSIFIILYCKHLSVYLTVTLQNDWVMARIELGLQRWWEWVEMSPDIVRSQWGKNRNETIDWNAILVWSILTDDTSVPIQSILIS